MPAIWRDWAGDVSGGPIDASHFLAEERLVRWPGSCEAFFCGEPELTGIE